MSEVLHYEHASLRSKLNLLASLAFLAIASGSVVMIETGALLIGTLIGWTALLGSWVCMLFWRAEQSRNTARRIVAMLPMTDIDSQPPLDEWRDRLQDRDAFEQANVRQSGAAFTDGGEK